MSLQPTDETIWQRLSTALFGARKTTDERLFTARVMAEVRQLQRQERPWRFFTRWAVPALALSMGSFTIAVAYSLRPDPVSAEMLILDDQEPGLSEAWIFDQEVRP